jgi:hypothetical protein
VITRNRATLAANYVFGAAAAAFEPLVAWQSVSTG